MCWGHTANAKGLRAQDPRPASLPFHYVCGAWVWRTTMTAKAKHTTSHIWPAWTAIIDLTVVPDVAAFAA